MAILIEGNFKHKMLEVASATPTDDLTPKTRHAAILEKLYATIQTTCTKMILNQIVLSFLD